MRLKAETAAQGSRMDEKPKSRRTKSYWEPFYDPDLKTMFTKGEWKNLNNESLTFKFFQAEALISAIGERLAPHFTEKHFADCDFRGYFDKVDRPISFTRCTFLRCDFGTSTWARVKFSKCTFQESSFTQCSFRESAFFRCKWERMGFSGTETEFRETSFSNVSEFINSRFINLSPEFVNKHKNNSPEFVEKHTSPILYAKAMHETSKEVIARMLFHSLKSVGDEAAFYEAGRLTSNQYYATACAWHAERLANTSGIRWFCRAAFLTGSYAETYLMRFVGFTNAWGASVLRPLLMLLATIASFSLIYWRSTNLSLLAAFAKSFEISSVAGYTRGAHPYPGHIIRMLEWSNLWIAIMFYTIFFATVVARVCRVR